MYERETANVLWADTASGLTDYFKSIAPWQTINHFPGMTQIARKSRLAINLEVMRRKFPKDFAFSPKTYVLPQEAAALRRDHFNNPKNKSSQYFIMKPSGGSQGKGIYLTRTWDKIDLSANYVAQRYIRRPLLIDKKKFDLRLYVLVTSCKPLRIYLFRDGLVRLCTQDFVQPNAQNTTQRCMHLTNYSINKHSKNFENVDREEELGSEGSKRSLKWFLGWLERERGRQNVENLWEKISSICAKTILSVLPTLVREYNNTFGFKNEPNLWGIYTGSGEIEGKNDFSEDGSCHRDDLSVISEDGYFTSESYSSQGETDKIGNSTENRFKSESRCFQILGFDILIDQTLRPYLIEVNHLPSFATDHDIDKRIKSALIEQALSIVNAKPDDRQVHCKLKKSESDRRLFSQYISLKCSDKKERSSSQKNRHTVKAQPLVELDTNRGNQQARKHINTDIVKTINNIYEKYEPRKLSKVPLLLRKYRGCEDWLLDQVQKKYCDSVNPAVDSTSSPEQDQDAVVSCVLNQSADSVNSCSDDGSENDLQSESQTSDDSIDCNERDESNSKQFLQFKDDVIADTESSLLVGFQRVYPPQTKSGEELVKGPDYKSMEKYVFDYDFKQQMRLVCPLRQARRVDPCKFKTMQNVVEEKIEEEISLYKTWSAVSWKESAIFSRKGGPVVALSKPEQPAPMPNLKQIEAAKKLSQGLPVNKTRSKECTFRGAVIENVYPSCYVDPSWHLSCRVSPTPAKYKQDSAQNYGNDFKKIARATAIKPVNFSFTNDLKKPIISSNIYVDFLGSCLRHSSKKTASRNLGGG